jgi:PEP-CTERM motif
MKTRLLGVLCVLAVCWLPAHAGLIAYSEGGTFAASTPSSLYSAPGETWAFSFLANSNPVVISYGNGGFDFAFSHFSYWLNGSPVAITPSAIRFFTAANGGGYFICLGPLPCGNGVFPNGLGTGGFTPQLYSGPNSAPTLLTGTFNFAYGVGVVVNSVGADAGSYSMVASPVPEPSTFISLSAGLLALGGSRRHRRK